MFNLSFFYKYLGYYIIFLQYSLKKYTFKEYIKLDKFLIYFNLINITDLDQTTISNYLYFFRYFFGILPYFTNYKHRFHLNIHYFSFYLQYFFKDNIAYNYIYIFLNDTYSVINNTYIQSKSIKDAFEYKVIDMNFFIEKKNTLGFFSLVDTVQFKFFFIKNIQFEYNNILYLFKLKV